MIRVFNHYFYEKLLILLLAEVMINFGTLYLCRLLTVTIFDDDNSLLSSDIAAQSAVFALIMMVIMMAMGLYERNLWRGRIDMLLRIGFSFIIGLIVIVPIQSVYLGIHNNQGEIVLVFGIALTGTLILRTFFTPYNHSLFKPFRHSMLVLGVGHQAAEIERLSINQKITSLVLGYVPAHEYEHPLVPNNRIFRMSDPRKLHSLAARLAVDEIVVAIDDRRQGFLIDEIMKCKFSGISVSSFTSFYEKQTGKIQLDALRPSSMIYGSGFKSSPFKRLKKRVFDVTVSLLLLILTWPIMILAALLVWIDSGGHGPILYRQTRVGLRGQPFDVIKIRSMQVGAERDGVARWAQVKDSRITRIGALLRKTRIDELPQLLNVLWGDMSFVGPRPERPQFVAELDQQIPFYTIRHTVKPGITGWAQICYPYGASMQDAYEKLGYDLYYIKNYSFFLDTLILLQTAYAVFWSKGAR